MKIHTASRHANWKVTLTFGVHASKDYVIVYSVVADEILVLIVRIAHRREVYRRL